MNMFFLFLVRYLTNFKLLKAKILIFFSSQTKTSLEAKYALYLQRYQQQQPPTHQQQQQQPSPQQQQQQQQHIYEDVIPGNQLPPQ